MIESRILLSANCGNGISHGVRDGSHILSLSLQMVIAAVKFPGYGQRKKRYMIMDLLREQELAKALELVEAI